VKGVRRSNTILSAILLLSLSVCAAAQVSVGEASMKLSSTISVGYDADYSNVAGSDHSFTPYGIADLSGYYYSPSFLSFLVEPFYGQSRLNSNFQSITAESGVNASAGIFSGSHFPGSISYSKIYNNSGNFGVPGLANYTTNANSDDLIVTWGVNLANLPNLNFSFSDGSTNYSIYGTNSEGNEHHDGFSAMAAYAFKGFYLNGGYEYTGWRSLTPQFLLGEPAQQTHASENSLSLTVSHNLPWDGTFTGTVTRHNISSDANGDTYTSNIDTASSSFSIVPVRNLTLSENIYYTNNLEGTLLGSLLAAGIPPQDLATQSSSNSLGLISSASYDIPSRNLHLYASASRQQQSYLGESLVSDSYYVGVTHFRVLLGGQFTGTVGLTQTSINTKNQSLLGLTGAATYTRQVGHWLVSGAFNYARDTQTALASYTGSNDGYSATLGRKIGRNSYWTASVGGASSYLTNQPGPAASSQTYSTSLSLPLFSINGSYSRSSGTSFETAIGLVPTPTPLPVVNPEAVLFYNGDSYSLGFGTHPVRGLTISGIFSRALSNTQSSLTSSRNSNSNLDFTVVYHFRKLDFDAGYLKFNQSFSASGTPLTMIGSYYVAIKRWFNIF
jgi:hypothetical protein